MSNHHINTQNSLLDPTTSTSLHQQVATAHIYQSVTQVSQSEPRNKKQNFKNSPRVNLNIQSSLESSLSYGAALDPADPNTITQTGYTDEVQVDQSAYERRSK